MQAPRVLRLPRQTRPRSQTGILPRAAMPACLTESTYPGAAAGMESHPKAVHFSRAAGRRAAAFSREAPRTRVPGQQVLKTRRLAGFRTGRRHPRRRAQKRASGSFWYFRRICRSSLSRMQSLSQMRRKSRSSERQTTASMSCPGRRFSSGSTRRKRRRSGMPGAGTIRRYRTAGTWNLMKPNSRLRSLRAFSRA